VQDEDQQHQLWRLQPGSAQKVDPRHHGTDMEETGTDPSPQQTIFSVFNEPQQQGLAFLRTAILGILGRCWII
jgi:hypothetical protein